MTVLEIHGIFYLVVKENIRGTKSCSLSSKIWDKSFLLQNYCGIFFQNNWLKEFSSHDEKSNPYKQVRHENNVTQAELQQISQQEAE